MTNDNARGVRYMVLAMTLFIINDSLVKYVSQSLPSGVLIFVRGLFASTLVLLAMRRTHTPLQRQRALASAMATPPSD